MNSRGRQAGGALPAAILLQLVLLLVGLQASLSAVTSHRAAVRNGAFLQARRLAEAALARVAMGGEEPLAAALSSGIPLQADLGALKPGALPVQVMVQDDRDGDEDPARDRNGRIRLRATARLPVPWGGPAATAVIEAEMLVAAWLPLPAALLDCAGGLSLCQGDQGCPVPAGVIQGLAAPPVAVPERDGQAFRQRLFVLTREVVRLAWQRCGAADGCEPANEDLLRALAGSLMYQLADQEGDPLQLSLAEVSLMVAPLLDLTGMESGPWTLTWWDGSIRHVPRVQQLVEAVLSLVNRDGHRPTLEHHPYPAVLDGPEAWRIDDESCSLLPGLLPLLTSQGFHGHESLRWIQGDLVIGPGEQVAGEGLLLVTGNVQVDAAGSLDWRGSVVVSGGRLAGAGRVKVTGSLIIAAVGGGAAIDLSQTALELVRDEHLHRLAWKTAGLSLLSTWPGPPEP